MGRECCCGPEPAQPCKSGGRRKLWEISPRYMCSVVGTCFSLKEIRKLALRDELCHTSIGDYDLHGLMVAKCRTRSRTSRAMHKSLERRYAAAVRRFAKVTCQHEILDLWADSVDRGDIPGPLWALLTHPLSSLKAWEIAFGDVHMLSHVLGATRRIEQKDLDKLVAALDEERAHTAELRHVIKERSEALEAAEERIAQRDAEIVKLESRLDDDRSRIALQQELAASERAFQALEGELLVRREAHDELDRQLRRFEGDRRDLLARIRKTEDERDAALEETVAAEAHLLDLLQLEDDPCAGCPALDGVRVLYVGGRTSLVPHYRAVVERQGGDFVHHDGGLEQSCAHLERLVDGAELVVCPLDAISHSSWQRVKKACLHRTRSFLPVRTSSMASLVTAIRRGVDQLPDHYSSR